MKNKYLVKSAAVAALLGAVVSAQAGVPFNTTGGDIMLAFMGNAGNGANGAQAATSVEFNIGNISTFTPGATVDLGSFNINTANSYTYSGAVTAANGAKGFGSGWATSGGVIYDVAGGDATHFYAGLAATSTPTTLATDPVTPHTGSVPAFGDTPTAQLAFNGVGGGMASSSAGAQLKAGTGGTVALAYLNSNVVSFGSKDPNSPAVAWSTFSSSVLQNQNTSNTVTGTSGLLNGLNFSALDLYAFSGNSPNAHGTFLGTLALTTGGEVFWVGAPIPEPSTYAAILGLATLGVVMIRRRKQAQA